MVYVVWGKLLNLLYKYRSIFRYGMYSAIVTLVDGTIAYLLVEYLSVDIVMANTAGIAAGFLLHYSLSIKNVFEMKSNRDTFLVYLGTFLMGLAAADFIVWIFYEVLKAGFFVSKEASIIIPFFAIYNMRKVIYGSKRKRGER